MNLPQPILVIETASRPGFVGLWEPAGWLAFREFSHARRQGEEIFDCIRAVLLDGGCGSLPAALPALRAMAVATGPGSFSSVRIGMGAAKSLAETAGVPLVGVSLLDAAAMAVPDGARLVTLPGSRGECYFAFYDADGRITDGPGVAHLGRLRQREAFHASTHWVRAGEAADRPEDRATAPPPDILASTPPEDLTLTGGLDLPLTGASMPLAVDPPTAPLATPQLARLLAAEAWRRVLDGRLDDPLCLDALYVRRDDADGAWTDPKADLPRITAASFPAGFPG